MAEGIALAFLIASVLLIAVELFGRYVGHKDVEKLVRCRECIRRYDHDECPMCHLIEGESYDHTYDDGYCDRGERRADDR